MPATPAPDSGLAAFADLLLEARLLGPHDLAAHIAEHGARLGFGDAVLYLADMQGKVWVPFLPGGRPDPDRQASPLGVDSTLAGRVFQSAEVLGQADAGGRVRTWVPVSSGVERLGVLGADLAVTSDTDEEEHRRRLGCSLPPSRN